MSEVLVVQGLYLALAGCAVCLGIDRRCGRACVAGLVLHESQVVLDIV